MLLNWGIDQADIAGLTIWGHASPLILSSGTASAFGFQAVDSFTLNLDRLERRRADKCKWPARKMMMKRPPFIPYENRHPRPRLL